jgi:hypothetical protein
MATGQLPTLFDVASREINGEQAQYVAEMLSQAPGAFRKLPFKEGTDSAGHKGVFRRSIPTGSWRQVNQGTGYSKTTTAQYNVGSGQLTAFSYVDCTLARRTGNVEQFRRSEDVGFLEGMGQTLEQAFWYGNTKINPAQFMGLSAFYNSLSSDIPSGGAQNGANVFDGGGKGSSNASLWLLCFGLRSIFGFYPRGEQAGLIMKDYGDQHLAYDALGNPYPAYTSYFEANAGVVPEDWRRGVRIANLDITNAGLAGPNAADLFDLLDAATMLVPTMGSNQSGITESDAPDDPSPATQQYIFCNRVVRRFMDRQAMRNRNVLLGLKDYAGMPITEYRPGIQIEVSDQLLTTEARVV